MATEEQLVEYALDYAKEGFAVMPLAARGKVPVTAHGKDDATTDLDIIRAWWSSNPQRNIGIRLPDNVIVLDVDPRSGGSLEALGVMPATRMAATGGGGWHLWFKFAGPVRGRLTGTPGIDIKTSRGYIVAPPSIHPSGARYRWLSTQPIATLPERLRTRAKMPEVVPRSVRDWSGDRGAGLVHYVENAEPGHRNQALFWAASRAYAEGGDQRLLHDLIIAASRIGLPSSEIERTVRSARRSG